MRRGPILFFAVLVLASCSGALRPNLTDERRACLGRGQSSIDACTRIIERTNVSQDILTEAYINRGNTHIEMGNTDAGLADMDSVIALDPNDPLAYFNKGDAYLVRNLPKQAIANFDRAIELDPSYAPSYSLRAAAHAMVGKDELAMADHGKAKSLNPSSTAILWNRARFLHRTEDYEAALADLSEAIRLRKGYARAYLLRGDIHRDLKRHEAAIADYTEAIRLGLDSAETLSYLAWELLAAGNNDRAVEVARRSTKKAPHDAEMHNALAHALMARGDAGAAMAAFDKAIDEGLYNMIWQYKEALAAKGYEPGTVDGKDSEAFRAALAACVRDNCQLLVRQP